MTPILPALREALRAPLPGGWQFERLRIGYGIDAVYRRDSAEAGVRLVRPGWPAWKPLGTVGIARLDDGADFPHDTLVSALAPLARMDLAWPSWSPDPKPLLLAGGIPRAGSTWAVRIVRTLVQAVGQPLGASTRDQDLAGDTPQGVLAIAAVAHEHLSRPDEVRVWKAKYFTGSPAFTGPAFRNLFVRREVRDVLLSQLHYAMHGPAGAGLVPVDQVLDALLERSLPPMLRALGRPPIATHVVDYEALVEHPKATIAGIAAWLGVDLDDDWLDLVVAQHAFATEAGRPRGQEDRTSYYRAGVVGGWREGFTPAQLSRIEAAIAAHR